jgi:hypothetical protein
LSGSPEEALGEVWVSTKLRFGSERIRLLITSGRIIVDHAGKRGPGAVAGTSILGELSRGLESLLRSGTDSVNRRKVEKMTPSQVLHAHKDNFPISYSEVVNVTVEKTLPQNRITILTNDDKYEFLTSTLFDTVVALFSKTLSDKLTARKLPEHSPF